MDSVIPAPPHTINPDQLRQTIHTAWWGWRGWVLLELALIVILHRLFHFSGALNLLNLDNFFLGKESWIAVVLGGMSLFYLIISLAMVLTERITYWFVWEIAVQAEPPKIVNRLLGIFILPLDMASEGGLVYYLTTARLPEALFLLGLPLALSLPLSLISQKTVCRQMTTLSERQADLPAFNRFFNFMEIIGLGFNTYRGAETEPHATVAETSRFKIWSGIAEYGVMIIILIFVIINFHVGYFRYYHLLPVTIRYAIFIFSVHLIFMPAWAEPVWRVRRPALKVQMVAQSLIGVIVAYLAMSGLVRLPLNLPVLVVLMQSALAGGLCLVGCILWRLIFRMPTEENLLQLAQK